VPKITTFGGSLTLLVFCDTVYSLFARLFNRPS